MNVGELQDALRRTPLGSGLDRAVLDLVVIAWAIRHQRAWTQYRASIPQPPPGKLARDMELHPQEMPSEEQWTTARHRAGAIFGVEAPQYLTAANLTTLARQVHEQATALREDARALSSALTEVSAQRGITVSNRLTAAAQGTSLVDDLAVLKGLPLLQRLADATLEASDQELGRSLRSAATVTRALKEFDTARLAPLAAGAEAGDETGRAARGILQDLDEALAGHQLQRPLEKALTAFDTAAWTWLSRRASPGPAPAPQPVPDPAPSAGRTGRRTVTWNGGTGLEELGREIAAQVREGTRVEITWRELP